MNRDDFEAHLDWAEGRRPDLYDDATGKSIVRGSIVEGYPSIGNGRNLQANPLSDEEINFLRARDIDRVEREATNLEYWSRLDPVRQLVVADLLFNLGVAGWRKFVRANAALSRGDYEQAANELESSRWYNQVRRRAVKLVEAMRTGVWD